MEKRIGIPLTMKLRDGAQYHCIRYKKMKRRKQFRAGSTIENQSRPTETVEKKRIEMDKSGVLVPVNTSGGIIVNATANANQTSLSSSSPSTPTTIGDHHRLVLNKTLMAAAPVQPQLSTSLTIDQPDEKMMEAEKLIMNDSTTDDGSRTPTPGKKNDNVDAVNNDNDEKPKESMEADLKILVNENQVNCQSINNIDLSAAESTTSNSSVSSSYDESTQNQPSPSTSTVVDENVECQTSKTKDELAEAKPDKIKVEQEEEEEAQKVGKNAKKRRARQKKVVIVEEASRKSTRINKLAEKEGDVVDNYTGTKDYGKPRGNQIPRGLKRIPYEFPSKAFKENGRLRIDMNGPSTRNNPGATFSPLKSRSNGKTREKADNHAILPDYQPIFNAEIESIEREQAIWIPPEDDAAIDKDGFNESWKSIQHQFRGEIPLDAVLNQLMMCNYNVDEMLANIESQKLNLPQRFEPLNNAQQAEFEKTLKRNVNTTNRTQTKNFRGMQERFLRQYHLGEIINFYYKTKRMGCWSLSSRCVCNEEVVKHRDVVQRFECENCTKRVRPNAIGSNRFCEICKLYFSRNNKHRENPGHFNDYEQKIIEKWCEMEKNDGRIYSKDEVFEKIEKERVDDIVGRQLTPNEIASIGPARRKDRLQVAKLLAPYQPIRGPQCTNTKDKTFEEAVKFRVKDYDDEQKFQFILAFEKWGKNFAKIAEELNLISIIEVIIFFYRFQNEYSIAKLIESANYNNSTNQRGKQMNHRDNRSNDRSTTPPDQTSAANKSARTRKRPSEVPLPPVKRQTRASCR